MSGSALSLQAEERTVTGKKVSALRRSGMVPAVVYEKGQESDSVAVSYIPLVKIWNKAGKHHAIVLKYGKKERLTVIKDATFDPVKGQLSHVAFHAINKNELIDAEVPVHLEGYAPATVAGLLVRTNLDHVVVRGIPGNIPDEIKVDISAVTNPEDDIRAGQLTMPANVTLETDPDTIIVSVVIPRAEVEKVEDEAVDAADVPSDHGTEKTEE